MGVSHGYLRNCTLFGIACTREALPPILRKLQMNQPIKSGWFAFGSVLSSWMIGMKIDCKLIPIVWFAIHLEIHTIQLVLSHRDSQIDGKLQNEHFAACYFRLPQLVFTYPFGFDWFIQIPNWIKYLELLNKHEEKLLRMIEKKQFVNKRSRVWRGRT